MNASVNLWQSPLVRFVGILMLDGDLDLGPVTDTYYSLFKKEISNIPTVIPSLFNQTRRITRPNVSVTRYKSVIKKAMTGRQPVYATEFDKNEIMFKRYAVAVLYLLTEN